MFKQISVAQFDRLVGTMWTNFCHGVSVLAKKDTCMSVKASARWCLEYLCDHDETSCQLDIEKLIIPIHRTFLSCADKEQIPSVLMGLAMNGALFCRYFGVVECKIPLPASAEGATFVNTWFPPSVFMNFPLNPHMDVVEESAVRFACTYGLYAEKFLEFQEMKISKLCGLVYATPSFLHNAERLRIAADWMTVLFHHTDAVDGFLGSCDEQVFSKLTVINDRLLAIITTPLHEFDFLDELAVSPRERALVDVYTRLVSHLNILDDSELLPLRGTFEDYLRATEWVCRAREIKMTCSFREYQWRRKDACGVQVACAVGLLMIGVPNLMGSSLVHSLTASVCDSVSIVRDLYSYWQKVSGVYGNVLEFRMSEHNLSLKDAFFACEHEHSECVVGIKELGALFLRSIDPISSDSVSAEEGVRFIQNLALANTRWAAITGRYTIDAKSIVEN